MLQAITAPLLTSILLGGVVLGAATQLAPEPESTTTHRLILHAIEEPDALYLTAWDKGDVIVSRRDEQLRPLTFTTRAWINDGCRWQGTETLRPIDGHSYAYDYQETILECTPDATPAFKTPRKGLVTVVTY